MPAGTKPGVCARREGLMPAATKPGVCARQEGLMPAGVTDFLAASAWRPSVSLPVG